MRKVQIPLLLTILLFHVGSSGVFAVDVQYDILDRARSYLGAGYCNGGEARPCFDCSGFVTALYGPFVPGLPRISRDMARYGEPVTSDSLVPGDLLFFATSGRSDRVTHVAIYVGQDSIIHSISDGPNRGVSITPLSARYWRTRFHSARRVLPTIPTATEVDADAIAFSRGAYTGELVNGEPSGTGRMVMNNGDRYEGEFLSGVFHGEGRYAWVGGDVYEGEFADGEMHGRGNYRGADGLLTTGRWVRGEYQGEPGSDQAGESAAASQPTYIDSQDSPWDTWDGVVMGDFYAWQEEQNRAFEEWLRNN